MKRVIAGNPKKPFTAYKVSTDGNQRRWDYNYDMTKADIDELPVGKQTDNHGDYTWGYGINNGNKI